MQPLTCTTQQSAVGGILHERVLELVLGSRRLAALEDQARLNEAVQPIPYHRLALWCGRNQQLIREFSADDRADLRGLLRGRTPAKPLWQDAASDAAHPTPRQLRSRSEPSPDL